MVKRIIIATGGTGGHIYPAIALAQQFAKEKNTEILFIGGNLAKNRYFDHSFQHQSVSCGAFTNKYPHKLLKSCLSICKGIWQSRALINNFNPDIVIGFGSYYSFPPLVAAKLQGVPILLHEANSIPGKVNKLLAPYSLATGVNFPQTLNLLKGTRYEVGMPLRNGFKKGNVPASAARDYYGLSHNVRTLLVFGGSQGANVISRAVLEALKLLEMTSVVQVIHITGDLRQQQELQEQYKNMGIRASVKMFEERMDLAWQAADLVVSRSGASSVAEQLEFEVPGILIPFAKAADDHQNHNADFLVKTVGGAFKLQERELELSPMKLVKLLKELLENEGERLQRMRQSMSEYKRKARTHDLYSLINTLCMK